MWWLILGGLGLTLLYDVISEEEVEARQRWEEKREEVEKNIERHQENIKLHIKQAEDSYNFYFLIDLHYSSVQVANSAYQLLDDAKTSLDGMNKMLKKSKEQRLMLQEKLKKAKKTNNQKVIYETIQQLKMLNELRRNIFEDRDKVKKQKESLLEEVRRLNSQTRKLKKLIRDRCGEGGRKWYERLEERKRTRRLAERKL